MARGFVDQRFSLYGTVFPASLTGRSKYLKSVQAISSLFGSAVSLSTRALDIGNLFFSCSSNDFFPSRLTRYLLVPPRWLAAVIISSVKSISSVFGFSYLSCSI